MGYTLQEKEEKKEEFFLGGGGKDQNRFGNETLADAALTWRMGNEIVVSFRCVPLSVRPSINLVLYPPAAEK